MHFSKDWWAKVKVGTTIVMVKASAWATGYRITDMLDLWCHKPISNVCVTTSTTRRETNVPPCWSDNIFSCFSLAHMADVAAHSRYSFWMLTSTVDLLEGSCGSWDIWKCSLLWSKKQQFLLPLFTVCTEQCSETEIYRDVLGSAGKKKRSCYKQLLFLLSFHQFCEHQVFKYSLKWIWKWQILVCIYHTIILIYCDLNVSVKIWQIRLRVWEHIDAINTKLSSADPWRAL